MARTATEKQRHRNEELDVSVFQDVQVRSTFALICVQRTQVVWVAHEKSIRPCLADSTESFLEQIANEYTAGHYSVHDRYGIVRSNVKFFPRSKLK